MVAGADYYCLSEANKADSKASRDSELDSKSTSKAERAICSKDIYIFNLLNLLWPMKVGRFSSSTNMGSSLISFLA